MDPVSNLINTTAFIETSVFYFSLCKTWVLLYQIKISQQYNFMSF